MENCAGKTEDVKKIIGLFFKNDRGESVEIADRIARADYADANVRFVRGEAAAGEDFEQIRQSEGFDRMTFAVSIGGDGTFLRTARVVRELGIPMYGINTGRLGFLASGGPEAAEGDVRRILSGDWCLVDRIPLKGEILRGGVSISKLYALNEITVTKGALPHPIDLDVSAGGNPLYSLLADGIIVATPTGSTAYALSAGGPIVHPGVKCLVVVPICPHSLYPRPVILGEGDVIEISLASNGGEMLLSGDGQLNVALAHGDVVRLALDNEKRVHVIKLDDASYYDVLQSKLNWGCRGERGRVRD